MGPTHDDQIPSSEEDELGSPSSEHTPSTRRFAQEDGTSAAAQTPAGTSIEEDEDGMLPRDKQRRTAFYDYTAEKQMSHTEAKQFYQRHQLETQYGGSQAGDSYSPAMRAKTFPANFGAIDGGDLLSRGGSVHSRRSNVSQAPPGHRSTLPIGLSNAEQSQEPHSHSTAHNASVQGSQNDADPLLQADHQARAHHTHPALPHEPKPMLAEEGIHGAGA
jgi:AMP deaminase